MVRTVRNLQYAGTTHKFASPINFFNFIQTLPKNSTKISLIAHTRLSRFESFQKPLSNLPSTEICKLKKNHVTFFITIFYYRSIQRVIHASHLKSRVFVQLGKQDRPVKRMGKRPRREDCFSVTPRKHPRKCRTTNSRLFEVSERG